MKIPLNANYTHICSMRINNIIPDLCGGPDIDD